MRSASGGSKESEFAGRVGFAGEVGVARMVCSFCGGVESEVGLGRKGKVGLGDGSAML